MDKCGGEQEYTSLVCWGSGEFGQHSHGHGEDVGFGAGTVQQFLSADWSDQVRLTACGASHTVAVTNSNDLYVWGNGNSGQLGCGSSGTKWKPQKVDLSSLSPSPLHIEGISCGGRHTVIWTKDGSAIGFGNNIYAQLGHTSDDQKKENQWTPHLLDFLPKTVRQVACGDKHTVFLLEGGKVACLGNNHHGQIGSHEQKEATLPRFVDLNEPIKQVASGANHSLALTVSGELYVWGYGKACHGNSAKDILQPEKLTVSSPVHQVAAGSTHCLLVTVSGDVFSWGDGSDGQLGHGEAVSSLFKPTLLTCDRLKGCVVGVACGESLSAAITDGAELFLWGRNSHTIQPDLPSSYKLFEPVSVSGHGICVRSVACGAWHASAIVTIPESEITASVEKVAEKEESLIRSDNDAKMEISSCETQIGDLSEKRAEETIQETTRVPQTREDWDETHREEVISQSPRGMFDFSKQIKLPCLPQLEGSKRPVLPKRHMIVPSTASHMANSADEEASRAFPHLGQGRNVPMEKAFPMGHKYNQGKVQDDNKNNCETSEGMSFKAVPAITSFPKMAGKDSPLRRSKTLYTEGQNSALTNSSRSLFPGPEPYSVHVSRSTAAKFALPKESTFVSNKTVGFVPLEHLAESVTWRRDSDTDRDSFSWINRHNSTNVQSNYIHKGHFPTRQSRFSSAKKFAPAKNVHGFSRHHTTLGVKNGEEMNYVRNQRLKLSGGSPDHPSSPDRRSTHFWDNKRESPDPLASLNSPWKGFTRQQIANREWDRNAYWKWHTVPDLKPLDRNMRNVNNLKSGYKSVSNARRKKKMELPQKSTLFENFANEDGSKLGAALAARQQSFILLSSTQH
ncbi:uncharacterized protein LOC135472746 [Liolophura sinensis]|uniref:uncharacterized protein LOC135472746 n=1 Tax=Liolophura sinensis TaxID=3198878 RepID=UPI0031588091